MSSSDETPSAPEAPASAETKTDEPAWPPAEARPEASTETDSAILTKPDELPPLAKSDEPASEPKQEMGLSESTLHWLVDGEQPVEPRETNPTMAAPYDPRAPIAGRKRTIAVIGGAALIALAIAWLLHAQADRNRLPAEAPVPAEAAAVLTQRAEAALTQGRGSEAMELAHLAISANARFSDAYIVVGAVQRDGGHLDEARAAYRKYLELAPLGTHAPEARNALAALPP